jgi:hypothetical protein
MKGNSYLQSATVQLAVNGIRKAGLDPCNRNIFSDFEFAEDATGQASTSGISHYITAPSDIFPVPHLQKR